MKTNKTLKTRQDPPTYIFLEKYIPLMGGFVFVFSVVLVGILFYQEHQINELIRTLPRAQEHTYYITIDNIDTRTQPPGHIEDDYEIFFAYVADDHVINTPSNGTTAYVNGYNTKVKTTPPPKATAHVKGNTITYTIVTADKEIEELFETFTELINKPDPGIYTIAFTLDGKYPTVCDTKNITADEFGITCHNQALVTPNAPK